MNTEIYVFADWEDFTEPAFVGTLRSAVNKNKEHFSFNYDHAWLQSPFAQKIDYGVALFLTSPFPIPMIICAITVLFIRMVAGFFHQLMM